MQAQPSKAEMIEEVQRLIDEYQHNEGDPIMKRKKATNVFKALRIHYFTDINGEPITRGGICE